NGNNYKLARSSEDIKLMLKGIKEAFQVLNSLGLSITPKKLNYFNLPAFLLMLILKPLLGTHIAEITMSKHTIAAVAEMKCLQGEFDSLIIQSGINTPAINELRKYLYSQIKG
ncbi:MAG: ketopantoate reductase, partial [Clostridiales bacterium]|nr:ketopantoate reductase [Clostridiales bacterium]